MQENITPMEFLLPHAIPRYVIAYLSWNQKIFYLDKSLSKTALSLYFNIYIFLYQ